MKSSDKTAQVPDWSDLANNMREAERLSIKLTSMVESMADARMVIEFDTERRKSALSRAVIAAFKSGADSTSRAEHEARSSVQFEEDMRTLAKHYAAAERVRLDYETTRIRLEVLRSSQSTLREQFKEI